MRTLLACTRFCRPRLTHACDRPARRWIASVDGRRCEHAPHPRHGWLATTAPPHALARWGWLKARRSSGRNPASTEARAVRSRDAHGPFTGGLSSCHRRTEFARRKARRRAAGAGSVPRARSSARALEPASSAGALERSRLGPRTTCSWVRGRASGGAAGGASGGAAGGSRRGERPEKGGTRDCVVCARACAPPLPPHPPTPPTVQGLLSSSLRESTLTPWTPYLSAVFTPTICPLFLTPPHCPRSPLFFSKRIHPDTLDTEKS